MKKRGFFRFLSSVLLFAALLSLASCNGREEGETFSVFSERFSAELTVIINESESKCIYEKHADGDKVMFTSPETLSGYFFTNQNGKTELGYKDMLVQANSQTGRFFDVLTEAFSPKSENITKIKTEKGEAGVVTVVISDGREYRFSEDGVPVSVNGRVGETEFQITVNSFLKSES